MFNYVSVLTYPRPSWGIGRHISVPWFGKFLPGLYCIIEIDVLVTFLSILIFVSFSFAPRHRRAKRFMTSSSTFVCKLYVQLHSGGCGKREGGGGTE